MNQPRPSGAGRRRALPRGRLNIIAIGGGTWALARAISRRVAVRVWTAGSLTWAWAKAWAGGVPLLILATIELATARARSEARRTIRSAFTRSRIAASGGAAAGTARLTATSA